MLCHFMPIFRKMDKKRGKQRCQPFDGEYVRSRLHSREPAALPAKSDGADLIKVQAKTEIPPI
jgi:hypothetical protein